MKKSAAQHLLPFEVDDALVLMGGRVAAVRRAHGLPQADLAAKAGIGMSTLVAIERGAATVQIGFWFKVLWALDLLGPFAELTRLGRDSGTTALLEARLPKRVRGRAGK